MSTRRGPGRPPKPPAERIETLHVGLPVLDVEAVCSLANRTSVSVSVVLRELLREPLRRLRAAGIPAQINRPFVS